MMLAPDLEGGFFLHIQEMFPSIYCLLQYSCVENQLMHAEEDDKR